jgi:hypothetical protein
MSSDLATTIASVTAAIKARLVAVSGMSADTVKYGVYAQPPAPKAITFSLSNTRIDESRGTLASEMFVSSYTIRMWAQATTDSPEGRDGASLALWEQVRTSLYVDKTLGATVRNVSVTDFMPPTAAGDIGEPANVASTVVTVVWQRSI